MKYNKATKEDVQKGIRKRAVQTTHILLRMVTRIGVLGHGDRLSSSHTAGAYLSAFA